MAIGALGAGMVGGAGINIVIRAVDKFSKIFASVNKRLVLMGTVSVIAGALIAGAMFKAGKAAVVVETEYAKVNTLLEKGQDAQKLFGNFVQETNVLMGNQGDQLDVLAGLYQTISAGITDTGEAQEFMNKATVAAVGGSAKLETVILAGTKAIAAFGLESKDTQRVFDLFAGTVKAGQTTMEQLAAAFPTVAGMAGQAGISIEETLGTFAGLTKVLGSTEETATSLSATIRGFIKPTEDMKSAVKALGFESATTMIKEKGLNESLKMLNELIDGDTEAMAKLFPNVRALKAVFPLLGLAADDVSESIDIVTNSAGLSQKQFEDMSDTVQYQWGVAMSNANNMLIDIGRVINGEFAPAIKFMGDIIKKVSELWLGLPEPIKKAIAIFGGVAAAILIVAGVIMIIVGTKVLLVALFVGAATAIWGAVVASLAFVAANIWWIAIILIVIALIANWKKVLVAFFGFMDIGANLWVMAWTAIKNIVIIVWNKIIDIIQFGVNKIIDMINWLIRQALRIPGISKLFPGLKEIEALDLSGAKGEITDLGKKWKELTAATNERVKRLEKNLGVGQEITKNLDENVDTGKKITEEIEEQVEIIDELAKQRELVKKLQGLYLIRSTGDIFDPTKGFLSTDFKTYEAFNIAKGVLEGRYTPHERGAVNIINIENIYGIDPDEIADALQDKLRTTTTI